MKEGQRASTTRVFVSYARLDRDFILKVVERLTARPEIEVLLDTEDILPTEEWRSRLEHLIAAADAIVFCLSPHSAKSEVCAWEVATAEALNKRIAPLVIADVASPVPEGLSKRNYIPATTPDLFEPAMATLIDALETDIAWIREHTRLGELSRRWNAAGRPLHELLHGAAVSAAEQWAHYRPSTAPEPTDTMRAFIQASRDEDIRSARRRRRARGALFGLSLSVVTVTGLAYAGYLDAAYLEGRMNSAMNRWHDAKLEVGGATRDCWSTVCPEMVLLPPGRFTMGSPDTEADRVKDEGPQHAVHISRAFLVGRYEVTFAEWEACYRAGGCSFLPSDHGWGRDRRPVVGLAWNDTQQYVSWLSRKTGMAYRLLTEAEWEYAARGLAAANGSENAFAWGADFVKDRANCLVCVDPPIGQTVAVGSFTPNAFGLYDMIGNVWEWVQDCYVDDYTRAPGDGSAATGVANCSRVLRGGAFNTGVKFIRTAYRNRQLPSQASRNFGFRVARDQSKP